ncbi:FGGY-family carbohydrate kinase [Candidatus Thiosymbion oneisti]|uniref:FGGY-family carbohydrate kinase n=1 Tax=Candidatus Thiosymbion oneisti TaxID=589554 RepID=UPI000B1B5C2B|nr:FGGY-family carbohydrate kinase [Candidatus Thiosymbion oneisti]
MVRPCYIGVDLGTSGCRAVAIDQARNIVAEDRTDLSEPVRDAAGGVEQDPWLWQEALIRVLRGLTSQLVSYAPQALCLDGTSATLLLCDPEGTPLGPALMYNDSRGLTEAERIEQVAPRLSPVHGAGSSLAKLLFLKRRLRPGPGTLALHQADWLLGYLTGRYGVSDWNNCLKLGLDPRTAAWPQWLSRLELAPVGLPRAVAPGTGLGQVSATAARTTGLPEHTLVLAGTTDSTAVVVATGAVRPGDAVTCLGSTLVLKIIGRESITAPQYGIYSHRFGAHWLIGGASNSGGAVLRRYFDDGEIRRLSATLDPDLPTGLDYYPLPAPGERFPINDGTLQPRLSPRPADDGRFFQGLLEGIARIEAAGYRRLHMLGAPPPRSVLTTGGGATNAGWTQIRKRYLSVPVTPARQPAATYGSAYGSAIIARMGGIPA